MTSPYHGQKILITGGLGFIGSSLARRLAYEGAHVTVIDSLLENTGANFQNIAEFKDRIRVIISDIADRTGCSDAISDCNIVFNLSGATSHLDSMTFPKVDLEANVSSQLAFLEIVRKLNPTVRIVFGSTRQVYGRPEYLPVDEKHSLAPVDVNGIHKLSGELYHQLFHKVYNFQSTVVRLTNTFGPRMRIKDARQTFLGLWIKKAFRGESFEVWGGEQLRDFSFIDDTVNALCLLALDQPSVGETYNVGGNEVHSLKQIANKVVTACGNGSFTINPYPAERKVIDIGDYYADSSKISKAVSWKPTESFDSGLTKTVAFFKEHFDEYL